MSDLSYETLSMMRSFELGARAGLAPDISPLNKSGDPRTAITAHIEWQFCSAFLKLFRLTNQDVMRYTATFAEIGKQDGLLRIDLAVPDLSKLSIETMRPIYDSMDRFVKRFLEEAVVKDFLYAEDDYACGKQVHIYHTPQAMIGALHALTHTKYKGNEDVLSHVYMARHLVEQLDHVGPGLFLN